MPVIYVNKPKGYTSFDICAKLRKVFNTKKIGHTGTLDPNATGVLVVLIDEATKANQFMVTDKKEYVTKVRVGIRTDTLDIDGQIEETRNCKMPSSIELKNILYSFLGKSKQIPPMTSAIKINGKKLYEYQRENIDVELPYRDIEVFDIELLDINELSFTFRCVVSSGTYIRALVRDILTKFMIIGTVEELTRTAVDNITIDQCDELDEIINYNYHLHDTYEVLSKKYETLELKDARLALNGARLKIDSDSIYILVTNDSRCIAMYQKDGLDYRCVRGLR